MVQGRGFRGVAIFAAGATFSLYAILLLSSLYFFKFSALLELLQSERMFFSLGLSVLAASLATLLSVTLAIPSAYALSRYSFPGSRFIDTVLEFPMIVSPLALGALLLVFFNTPFGTWLQDHGPRFVFAFWGIVLAQFITTAGLATRLLKAALDEIPRRYEDVARSLGASPAQAFFRVTVPLARGGILAAVILTWAKAIGEFGATMMVAGCMPMRTETMPIAIFLRLSTADIEGSVILIWTLVLLGFVILYLARVLGRNGSLARNKKSYR